MPTNYTSMIQNAITQYANDGVGLYKAIRNIHIQAKAAGDSIDYPGGSTLNITVCLDDFGNAQEIPLSDNVNFRGCTFYVTNNTGKEFNLFSLKQNSDPNTVTLNKEQLRRNATVYGSNNELDSTPKLIIVEDQAQWTTRTEYDENNVLVTTPFYRKDVLYVVGNIVQNNPITTYNNSQSSPLCKYINVNTNQKSFRSIIFRRTEASNALTNLITIKNQYNVLLDSVITITPEQYPDNGIYHDRCINIEDSAKIILNSVVFNHTYSAIYHWGYGISIYNVWDTSITNLTACNPAKGVMGNENVNELTVENSNLNRVDVHCYGRDITCINCTFQNTSNTFHIYNRVSSFYGSLTYNNCTFNNFLPLRIDSAYNAFTPFDLIFENCTLNVASNHKSLVNTMTMVSTLNPRPELQAKCLPKIIITNMHLNIPSTVTDFCFIKLLNNDYTGSIHYMNIFIVYVSEYSHAGSVPVTIYDVNETVTLTEQLTRITNISMICNLVSGF